MGRVQGLGSDRGEERRRVGEAEQAEEVRSGAAGKLGFVAGGQDRGADFAAEPAGGAGSDDLAGRGQDGSRRYLAPRRRRRGRVRRGALGQLGPQFRHQHPRPLGPLPPTLPHPPLDGGRVE